MLQQKEGLVSMVSNKTFSINQLIDIWHRQQKSKKL